jgi:hypothetical protein
MLLLLLLLLRGFWLVMDGFLLVIDGWCASGPESCSGCGAHVVCLALKKIRLCVGRIEGFGTRKTLCSSYCVSISLGRTFSATERQRRL